MNGPFSTPSMPRDVPYQSICEEVRAVLDPEPGLNARPLTAEPTWHSDHATAQTPSASILESCDISPSCRTARMAHRHFRVGTLGSGCCDRNLRGGLVCGLPGTVARN